MGDELVIIVIVAAAGIFIISRLWFTNFESVRKGLGKVPKTRIADVKEGAACHVGGIVVYGGKTLTAPLSGRTCSYYHVLVHQRHGKNRHTHTIIDEHRAGHVILQDESGYALVQNDKNLLSYILKDKAYSSGFLEDATPAQEDFLRSHGQDSEGFLGMNKLLRYEEGVLEAGEKVSVAGRGLWKSTSSLKLQLPADRVLLIVPQNESPIYLTDDPDIQ